MTPGGSTHTPSPYAGQAPQTPGTGVELASSVSGTLIRFFAWALQRPNFKVLRLRALHSLVLGAEILLHLFSFGVQNCREARVGQVDNTFSGFDLGFDHVSVQLRLPR